MRSLASLRLDSSVAPAAAAAAGTLLRGSLGEALQQLLQLLQLAPAGDPPPPQLPLLLRLHCAAHWCAATRRLHAAQPRGARHARHLFGPVLR